jgi:hypothetical protein
MTILLYEIFCMCLKLDRILHELLILSRGKIVNFKLKVSMWCIIP